jgi:hypothetical protein
VNPLSESPARWACLRVEYAARYPGLDPGVWYPAQSVADYFRAWLLRHPGVAVPGYTRLLETEHFEFRGGIPREAPWVAGRSAEHRAPADPRGSI